MSVQFKPFSRREEEEYDNISRAFRNGIAEISPSTAKEYEQTLKKYDEKWAKEGEQ